MHPKPRAKRGRPAKFERGDIVLVKMPEARADGATFTVTGREYDRRFKIWFYHGANTCSYAESLLKRLENKAKTR